MEAPGRRGQKAGGRERSSPALARPRGRVAWWPGRAGRGGAGRAGRRRGAGGSDSSAVPGRTVPSEVSPRSRSRSPAGRLPSSAAGEVTMGSLRRQVGSAPAVAAGGPGMCEGRDDSDCRRPLCATPWLYIPGAKLLSTWAPPAVPHLRRKRW
jgi:hypothetical protein